MLNLHFAKKNAPFLYISYSYYFPNKWAMKTSLFIIVDMHLFQRTYYRMAEETSPVNSSINLIMGVREGLPSLKSF